MRIFIWENLASFFGSKFYLVVIICLALVDGLLSVFCCLDCLQDFLWEVLFLIYSYPSALHWCWPISSFKDIKVYVLFYMSPLSHCVALNKRNLCSVSRKLELGASSKVRVFFFLKNVMSFLTYYGLIVLTCVLIAFFLLSYS